MATAKRVRLSPAACGKAEKAKQREDMQDTAAQAAKGIHAAARTLAPPHV